MLPPPPPHSEAKTDYANYQLHPNHHSSSVSKGDDTQQHNTCLWLPILGIKIYIEKRGGLRITGIHIIESVNTRMDDRCKCAPACYDFFLYMLDFTEHIMYSYRMFAETCTRQTRKIDVEPNESHTERERKTKKMREKRAASNKRSSLYKCYNYLFVPWFGLWQR